LHFESFVSEWTLSGKVTTLRCLINQTTKCSSGS